MKSKDMLRFGRHGNTAICMFTDENMCRARADGTNMMLHTSHKADKV